MFGFDETRYWLLTKTQPGFPKFNKSAPDFGVISTLDGAWANNISFDQNKNYKTPFLFQFLDFSF